MPLFPYLSFWLKMVAISAVLLGYYHLFLRKTGADIFNRYYLLGSVFLALQLPLVHIPLPAWTDPVNRFALGIAGPTNLTFYADNKTTITQLLEDYNDSQARNARTVLILYSVIAFFFCIPLIRWLYIIRRLKRRYTPLRVADISVYPTVEPGTPFSFFNSLFWDETLSTDSEDGKLVFRRELYRMRQLHTLDILALEIVRRLFWCNPFFFWILREQKGVHERLAHRSAPETAQRADTPPQTAANRLAGSVARWLTLPLVLILIVVFAAKNPNFQHKKTGPLNSGRLNSI